MTSPTSSKLKPQADRKYARKWRDCLMCHGTFVSEWPGERICQNCKKGVDWRNGASLPNASPRA